MLLSTAQAAHKTGTPLRTIQWAINHGHLPAERFGGKVWMIDETDLEAWMAGRRKRVS